MALLEMALDAPRFSALSSHRLLLTIALAFCWNGAFPTFIEIFVARDLRLTDACAKPERTWNPQIRAAARAGIARPEPNSGHRVNIN